MKNKPEPKSFRITEETSEKFREISRDLQANQEETLAKLIHVYEMELGRAAIPESRENIDMFEGYTRAIVNMYMQALESNKDMRAVVRTEYETQLKTKDKLIAELHERVDTAESIAKNAQKKSAEDEETIEALQDKVETSEKIISQVRIECDSTVFSMQTKYEALESAYVKLQAADQETQDVLMDFMTENKRLKEENDKYHEKNRELDIKIFSLGRENQMLATQLEDEKKRADEAIEQCSTKLGLEHKLAMTELENKLKAQHKDEIDELRKELDKYKELYYQKTK